MHNLCHDIYNSILNSAVFEIQLPICYLLSKIMESHLYVFDLSTCYQILGKIDSKHVINLHDIALCFSHAISPINFTIHVALHAQREAIMYLTLHDYRVTTVSFLELQVTVHNLA